MVGLLSSITLYMRTHLGMSAPSAAVAISVWQGVCYLTPLMSAYCADAKWGRAKTLLIAQVGNVISFFSAFCEQLCFQSTFCYIFFSTYFSAEWPVLLFQHILE